jgi:two-component system sensor histidine kinase/response regulator
MNSLRFLLVHRSPAQSEAIATLLAQANHSVMHTAGLAEAADALTVERFDAVLMESEFRSRGLKEFSAELRRLEQSHRGSPRVPLIGLGPGSLDNDFEQSSNGRGELDLMIPEPIDARALTDAVAKLAYAVTNAEHESAREALSVSILDPEKFREQVGYDNDLMVEIIDLFLEERQRQEPEMRAALTAGDLEALCRLAHTIKGSLGSLHALRARSHAEELEYAAKRADEDVCRRSLAALEVDLAELEPQLLTLRAS